MNYRLALVIGAILAACYAVALILLIASAHAATVHHYRRPYAALIGIRPNDVETFKCHNRNFRLRHVYLFGGCKEIGKG